MQISCVYAESRIHGLCGPPKHQLCRRAKDQLYINSTKVDSVDFRSIGDLNFDFIDVRSIGDLKVDLSIDDL